MKGDSGYIRDYEKNNNGLFSLHEIGSFPAKGAIMLDFGLDQDNDPDILGNNFVATGGLLWYEQTSGKRYILKLYIA